MLLGWFEALVDPDYTGKKLTTEVQRLTDIFVPYWVTLGVDFPSIESFKD